MIQCGIDRIDQYAHLFEGKRVGLITNPTGVNQSLISTIDVLNEKVNLVALFSPEHGVRGDLQAGVSLEDYKDPKTGITVFSLYGKNKKPSKEMMDQIDVLVFDIQDVGARFYTFIYTMAYALMACAEEHKLMVVLDRPNPVNGIDVEGNILDITYRSFVGYYPLPQRYGLTIGELARFFNQEFEIHAPLEVVQMSHYQRSMSFKDTGLHWIMPSPNIPTPETTLYYLSTCIFEGTNMSEGRGTTKPFHIIGSPYFDAETVIHRLSKLQIKGIAFRQLYFTPTFSKHKGELCNGMELLITDTKEFKPVTFGYILLDIIRATHDEFDYIPPFKEGHHQFIDLITGDKYVREHTLTIEQMIQKIAQESKQFDEQKRRYHLYE